MITCSLEHLTLYLRFTILMRNVLRRRHKIPNPRPTLSNRSYNIQSYLICVTFFFGKKIILKVKMDLRKFGKCTLSICKVVYLVSSLSSRNFNVNNTIAAVSFKIIIFHITIKSLKKFNLECKLLIKAGYQLNLYLKTDGKDVTILEVVMSIYTYIHIIIEFCQSHVQKRIYVASKSPYMCTELPRKAHCHQLKHIRRVVIGSRQAFIYKLFQMQ